MSEQLDTAHTNTSPVPHILLQTVKQKSDPFSEMDDQIENY